WLEMQKAEAEQKWPDCPWVFHHHNQPIGSHIRGFVEACKSAGLPRLRFHDLRSAVRDMAPAGSPRKIPLELCEHRRYRDKRRDDIGSQQELKLAKAKREGYLDDVKAATVATKTATVDSKTN